MHCLILSSDKNQDIPIIWQFFSDFNPNLLTVGLFLHILTKALGIFPGIAAVLFAAVSVVLSPFANSGQSSPPEVAAKLPKTDLGENTFRTQNSKSELNIKVFCGK